MSLPFSLRSFVFCRCAAVLALLVALPGALEAGGPGYVAGVTYFNASVLGHPAVWPSGQLTYFVDQGPLNSALDHEQGVALIDAAAAVWNGVSTAAVHLTNGGTLAEDVSGLNATASSGVLTAPADVLSSALARPVAVIFDSDGSVTDTLYGAGASDPTSCQLTGLFTWIDAITTSAQLAHGVILINGRCYTTASRQQMLPFQLERAFGRLLGLGYAQVNHEATAAESDKLLSWPIMQPISGECSVSGGECLPGSAELRYDDIAALSRLYPVTSANIGNFSGRSLTAASTISLQGTIRFRTGTGMQGVNVVATPLDSSGNPLYQYTVTAVSGALFNGNHGNPVTGWVDSEGVRFDQWGSNDSSLQGWFDLSGIPLPPGLSAADYQIRFEAVDRLFIEDESVGPYRLGQVTPSGTLSTVTLSALGAGAQKTLSITVSDSASNGSNDAISSEAEPRTLPPGGFWRGRLGQIGQSDWFAFPVRAGRTFTIVTQALDESSQPSAEKAMPTIGLWNATDAVGSSPTAWGPGFNGYATGETWLRVTSSSDDAVRIGISDMRGDGRPDYSYSGWVLYADTVYPARLPASGGAIVIHGTGFRIHDTVMVGGQQAVITSIAPTEITAIAPASSVTGSVDVEVDDEAEFSAAAILPGGISYDAASGDALTLDTAPANTVPVGVPVPFAVTALGSDLKAAGGVAVLFTRTQGTAQLGCGLSTCAVTTSGDGLASMQVTAVDGTWSIVTASLSNGASLQAQFAGGSTQSLSALTGRLSLAAGATIQWPVQALVESGGLPVSGQSVVWQSASGFTLIGGSSATTDSSGIATKILTVGPLSKGQTASIQACVNGTSQCVSFSAFGARPEYATLHAISGAAQSLSLSDTPAQISLRVLDMDGKNLAGAQVSLVETAWSWQPVCPTHGICAAAGMLAQQSASGSSAVDGSIRFTPLSVPDTATMVYGVASTGDSASVNLQIERKP